VVPAVAFGVASGPPVLCVNHADHAFWAGGAAVDVVLDLRPAGRVWTERHRGIPRTALLPILVPDPAPAPLDRGAARERRAAAKAQLGVPADSLVLLTVAHGGKYRALPRRGLDFLAAAQAILRACPRAWLIAAGPRADPRWTAAARATRGRVRADGPQRDLAVYHAAADVYLESFPLRSATAMLEAAIVGVPCVPGPRTSLPPTGGLGAVETDLPEDAEAYVREALRLLESETARRTSGEAMAAAVRAAHGPTSWLAGLNALAERLPVAHRVHPLPDPEPLPADVVAFWSEWSSSTGAGRAEAALGAWLEPRHGGSPGAAGRARRILPAAHTWGYGHVWDLWRWLQRARSRGAAPGRSGPRPRPSPGAAA
jgi:hypothetical protein